LHLLVFNQSEKSHSPADEWLFAFYFFSKREKLKPESLKISVKIYFCNPYYKINYEQSN